MVQFHVILCDKCWCATCAVVSNLFLMWILELLSVFWDIRSSDSFTVRNEIL